MNKKKIIISIIIIFLLCVALVKKSLSDSNDTFYLIKIGEDILKNGIDFKDHFSWIPNLYYTYPHWLYSVFLYFIYSNFGFDGIYISNILIYFIFILSIYLISLKVNKSYLLSLIIGIISAFSLSYSAVARSHSVSIICFVWEVYFIYKLCETGRKRYILFLMALSFLVANIHGTSWIMFFILFLPFVAEEMISKITKKKIILNDKITLNKINNFKLLIISLILCLFMGLFTPSRICYTYVFKTMIGSSQNYISEHLPLIIIKAPLIIILLFLMYFSKARMKLSELLMLSGLFLMCFSSSRHMLFVFSIGLLYISVLLKRNLLENNDKTIDILERKIFNNNYICLVIVILIAVFSFFKLSNNLDEDYIDNSEYPVLAANYIKDNLDYKNIKLYNNYNIGSYLLFNDIKVFIDSRSDLYFKEFNHQNMDIFDDLVRMEDDYNYDELFDKYEISYVLLDKKEILYHIIKNDLNYKELYCDDNFIIYKREK